MKKRTYINRICIQCLECKLVRKDSVSEICNKCSIKLVIRSNIGNIKDISDQKFGRLTAKFFIKKRNQYWWHCLCECGSSIDVLGNRLRSGKTKSCGCLLRSRNGKSTSLTYRSWRAMIQRCNNKNVAHYARYGARGITVCPEWLNSFDQFVEDLGERPRGTTLDRIDNTQGYYRENCRWATNEVQVNNRNNNHIIEYNGVSKSLNLWAKEIGISPSTLRKRICDLGWSLEDAFNLKK